MKHLTLAGWLLLLPLAAQANPSSAVRAEPETFRGEATLKAAPAVTLRLPVTKAAQRAASTTANTRNALTLPALTASEMQALQNVGADKAFRVGVGRDLPASVSQPMDLDTWQWTAVSGGKAAHFTLTSSGALRVRAQVQLGQMPAGVELRFYAVRDPSTVFDVAATANSAVWSPTVEGDSVGLEVFLPTGVAASQVELALPQISHLVIDPASGTLKSSIFKEDYASCQQDVACASPAWQETGKSVARYVFTDTNGLSYMCSGTVLADKDTSTQIPYFFTAAHCVNNAQAASTMDLFWMYANTTCGGTTNSFTQTTGGAELLAAKPELDTTFVRLNKNPPVGVTLSGWTTTPLSSNQAVTGIHHALGQPKKYAQGTFQTHASMATSSGGYTITPNPNGDFSQVMWHTGITAPGSSGSGIWLEQGGVHYLNGTLLGGSSSCTSTDAPDEYSRFESTWPFISMWLDAPSTPPPSLRLRSTTQAATALVEGVIIARYLQGLRGSALLDGVTTQALNTTTLETQLAAVQQVMDVDNDGKADAPKDAALLMRYLLGLRNAPLIQGLDLSTSGRKTASEIATYLATILK